MRAHASEMQQLDERILECLDDRDYASISMLADELPERCSRARVRERVYFLRWACLIAPLHRGSRFYELTARGAGYLEGEVRAEDLVAAQSIQPTPPLGSV